MCDKHAFRELPASPRTERELRKAAVELEEKKMCWTMTLETYHALQDDYMR
jgi:hypothetical protein